MAFSLSSRSLAKLKGVHPDLVRVAKRVITITPIDFIVTCGLRTLAEQKILVKTGKSRTLNSRHVPWRVGYAYAIDVAALVDGEVSWNSAPYKVIAKAFKEAAKLEGVPIEWGGEAFGPNFIDSPHFQLPWEQYPK